VDLSLNDWLTHLPPELVAQHLGLDAAVLAAIPKDNLAIMPRDAAWQRNHARSRLIPSATVSGSRMRSIRMAVVRSR
jgi:hypothetical protein